MMNGGLYVKISKEHITFQNVPTQLLIVGVRKHVENIQDWSAFESVFGQHISEWIRTGDIETTRKKITKIPLSHDAANVKRILFVGLGDHKTLDDDTLRDVFGLVGKQLKEMKIRDYCIWLDSFTTEHIEATDVAFLATEGIGLGYYTMANYKTTSNDVDCYLEKV